MPRIPYTADNFPMHADPLLVGGHDLELTWAQIVWAAVSVGKADLAHLYLHGPYSYFEIAFRTAIVYANLVENPDGTIRRSSVYEGLDPSEKGAISYFLGLAITKAFAAQRLDTPWLMHLDVYRQQLAIVLAGGTRPDLLGLTNAGDWVVVESKGRTNGFDAEALSKAKDQASQVAVVGGVPPSITAGCLIHFTGGILQLAVDDPSSERKSRIRIPLDEPEFIGGYYRPIRAWLGRAEGTFRSEIEGIPFIQAKLPGLDISVGMSSVIVEEDALALPRRRVSRAVSTEGTFAGPDSVVVSTGPLWTPRSMMREPQERALDDLQAG
jgi:hypothetical protein